MGTCLSVDDNSDEETEWRRSFRASRKQRKKQIMEVLAAEAKNSEMLFRMPGRMFLNGSSTNACIFTQQGRKGTNQDAMVVWESFASRVDTTFCGVFDGHGPFGHLVAKKVRDTLPTKLASFYKTHVRHEMKVMPLASPTDAQDDVMAIDTEASLGIKARSSGNEQNDIMFSVWKECFLKTYHAMDMELKSHPTIDCFCSGTTAVTMLLQGQDMVIANVGDSRAVLATLSDEDNTTVNAIQLSVDLKPNLPLEAERIKRCKGRVFALEDEPEVARVWLPHDDSPGLAMARAFGDFCLKDFGLIAVPEVTYTRLTERDQFVVLASDGIWDVLSNKEVVDTIWEAPTRTTAARSLVETAVRAWRLKYPTSKVDDCAVVCYYFNKKERWQAQAVASAYCATDVEKLPSTEVSGVIQVPVELNRSETVRSNNVAGVDDAISIAYVSESNAVGEENSDPINEDYKIELQDVHAASSGSLLGAEVLAMVENANPEDTKHPNSTRASVNTAALRDSNQLSTSLRDHRDGESEVTNVIPLVLHEEAHSEITELSDEGDEVEKPTRTPFMGRSSSRRSLAECLSLADEDEWSALEGVARVNSLLHLPRLLGGGSSEGKTGGSPSFGSWSSFGGKGSSRMIKKKKTDVKRKWI
ncbi:hypothetical protein KP509_11G055400 [Ceratopteris richardii]|uniref:PPM-type phosphatase domain-containing protein n=1 Tax=Ceratopteris richardii TaxID=49495 RepID=A0A8T2TUY3_CERRI|nr:hypothetical protein KP509_11G055400 [Ceratopteris richardii]